MVYKKYIKRNGKFYGPYIYNSRRVNGKVISEYHGTGKKDYKRFAFFILGILLLAVSVFVILNSNGKISGNVIVDNQISSQSENVLTNESGTIIYPSVYFTLILNPATPEKTPIVPETNNILIQNNPAPQIDPIPNELVVNSSTQTNLSENSPTANLTIPNPTVQNSTTSVSQPTPIANSSLITPSAIEPTPPTTSSSNSVLAETSTTIPVSTESTTSSTQTQPTTSAETSSSPTTTPEQTATTPSSPAPANSESTAPSAGTSSEPTTGNIVSQVLDTVSNFFLGFLRSTGMAVSNSNSAQINGEVSADKPFSYSFKEGENVQLLPGSVKTTSKSLSDNTIKIIYENNGVLISTDYSEKIISNPVKNNSNLKADFNIQPLNEKEKEILNSGFGNYSIETTKSELYNGRYVVEYVLGDYNIKYSYDYLGMSYEAISD
ncbi:MAG: hypothetical protein AABX99_00035, partial [Nanoarchaeota archaeon]